MTVRSATGGPRVLLRRLREAMALPATPQARLNTVARTVASGMVAEVCSIYLMREGEILELFATEGLNPDAVHVTRLKVGEGLVGDIAANARPLALDDAQSHPQFAYRPETGEEIYHSLLGVPVLRSGRVIGVVVVQNRTRRQYAEEEIEALETIAMVLAELIGSAHLLTPEELARVERVNTLPHRAEARSLVGGIGIGLAVLHEPRIEIAKTIAEDVTFEKQRLDEAFSSMRASVDQMLDAPEGVLAGESRDILETYKMFAHDAGWVDKLHQAVDSGLTAEAAVQRVQVDTRHRMSAISDAYLRERLADLEDLSYRLLRHLAGQTATAAAGLLPEDAVVFARHLGPAELLDYDRSRLRGLVLEEGSATSHVAIVARALDIPVVGGATGIIARTEPGDRAVVDGEHGQVFLRPGEEVLRAFRQNLALRQARLAKYAAQCEDPPVTRDGKRISLMINAGLLVDLPHVAETNADGVGLYRTELQFMLGATLPKVEAQTDLYARVLDQAQGRPVVFRTLDVGGDKVLPYLGDAAEENPIMGWRAIRIGLDRPGLLKAQVRAFLQASAGRELDVMFPMVAEVSEFVRARALLESEAERLRGLKRPPPSAIRVGTMLEVPALAWQLPALLQVADFVSVGSNDLLQFLFAADRGNPRLADRYDPLSPAVLNFLRDIVRQCDDAGVPVTLCGEMAGRPLEAMALLGIGFRRLSMSAGAIGPVKEMLRSVDIGQLESHIRPLMGLPDHSVRRQLQKFARENQVII